ncbi:geranylgeranyl-diphosphate geranylgeranyltransferase [Halobacteriales archaeon QH_6_64_20]|nr:MAG: geranylgeranyl-diphosphate geranylgeranyltransferase [Halobacteriales archaeon QH_6_64_20]
MVDSTQLAKSKGIHRRTGKTFYFATRVLPERVRRPTYVLYAFFRIADEIVDDPGDLSPAEQRAELERLRAEALGERETTDPVLAAFCEIRAAHGIPDDEVNAFVDAMISDIETSRYDTYADLEAYMRGSAAAVGHMMTAIMGADEPAVARPHAGALGEAFQLTNFIRDVREDIVDRDRIYLPETTLDEHGVDYDQLRRFEMDDAVAGVISTELHRAEDLYREGVAGIKYLPEDCQFAVLLASVLYADHHRLIRTRDLDVLSATPQLSTTRKLYLVARTRWEWVWNKDPETVFEAVSPLSHATAHRRGPEEPALAR